MLQTNAGNWIHYPIPNGPKGLEVAMHCLIEFEAGPELRALPEVATLCRLLGEHGVIPGPETMSRFLSIIDGQMGTFPIGISPCGMLTATMLLSCFPLSRLHDRKGFRGVQSRGL